MYLLAYGDPVYTLTCTQTPASIKLYVCVGQQNHLWGRYQCESVLVDATAGLTYATSLTKAVLRTMAQGHHRCHLRTWFRLLPAYGPVAVQMIGAHQEAWHAAAAAGAALLLLPLTMDRCCNGCYLGAR